MSDAVLKKKIGDILERFRLPLWGVCGVDTSLSLPEKYEKALVIVIPYVKMLTIDEYCEPLFKGLQWESFSKMRDVAAELSSFFRSLGIRFGFPPETESRNIDVFERDMTEVFNAKEAARCCGLGWIGKNNLLVTEKYGPRVSILGILCDIPLPSGAPVEKSRCGSCSMCSRHCALHVIRNKLWEPGMKREEQVDYVKCSLSRLKGYETIGRKLTCGKCIVSCPFGVEG